MKYMRFTERLAYFSLYKVIFTGLLILLKSLCLIDPKGKAVDISSNIKTQIFEHQRVPSRLDLKAAFRPGSLDNVRSENYTPSDVFVKVEVLQAKNTFGLNTLKFCLDAGDDVFEVNNEMEPPILSLVSCGSEVIMLSKKIFLKYADQKCRTAVRDHIKVYPSETVLQDNMQLEADWCLFKNILLEGQLKEKKMKSRLHSTGKN